MFIRVKSTPNSPKKAVQIVESIRDGEKVRQRIVRHIGTALDENELQRLKELAVYIKTQLETETQPNLFPAEYLVRLTLDARLKRQEDDTPLPVDLKKLRELQRVIVGIHEVYGRIYQELGFDKALVGAWRKRKTNETIYHLVMARIAHPSSKRSTVNDLSRQFGVELSLQSVYRSLDELCEKTIDRIQKCSYTAAVELLARPLSVVFYDCTTLYFESLKEDALKEHGYSKDNKPNQSQVLLALLVTPEGLPIGYEVFPGSTYEGHTLKTALDKLREHYTIERIIFVADSALLSKNNLAELEYEGIEYIVAARLKSLPEKIQEKVLNRESYETAAGDQPYERIRSFELSDTRRLIVTYSQARADKDRYDREKAIQKLKKRLEKSNNPTSLLSNYGYKKFVKLTGSTKIEVDEEKIEKASQWDGLHGVITNVTDMSQTEVVAQYHGLWQIEQCFRISKHDLAIRPIFHWTPRRIKAHIALCFMALVCARHMTHRFAIQYEPLSFEQIRRELISVQMSVLKNIDDDTLYGVPSNITPVARRIYQSVGLKLSNVPFKIR